MANPRADILLGYQAAEKFHRQFDTPHRYIGPSGQVDIFGAAADHDVPVMFRKLNGLLGAYLPDPVPGILINIDRPQSVQRFTCAHEFGHFCLKHQQSLDDESTIGFAYSASSTNSQSIERQADAFAFSFLMPRWLMNQVVRRLVGAGLVLPSPVAAYQLSLRLGCSYLATVLTLENYKMLSSVDAAKLKSIEPRKIKSLLADGVPVEDWNRDVWVLTKHDENNAIAAGEKDLFITRISEASTAGYITDTKGITDAGFTLLHEQIKGSEKSEIIQESIIGEFPAHEAFFQTELLGTKKFSLKQGRSWEFEKAQAVLNLEINSKKREPGLTEEERKSLLKEFSND